jgi:hypothetical protein
LIEEVWGIAVPAAYHRRSPGADDRVTVVLTTTELASAGIPHCPWIMKVRLEFAAIAGPPQGPTAFLVSRIRQGVTV